MKWILRFLLLVFVCSLSHEVFALCIFPCKVNQWKNNKYHGLWISWSDSLKTKVESRGRYKDGHERGIWKYFYEDGTLRRKERYSKKGISTRYYYATGKIKSKGRARVEYEGDYLHYYYDGPWTYFDEHGKPAQVITYEKGIEISVRDAGRTKKE